MVSIRFECVQCGNILNKVGVKASNYVCACGGSRFRILSVELCGGLENDA